MIGISRRWGHAVAAVLSVLYLVPLALIVITSLKSDDQIRGVPMCWCSRRHSRSSGRSSTPAAARS